MLCCNLSMELMSMYDTRRSGKRSKSHQFKLNAISYINFTVLAAEPALCAATPGMRSHTSPFVTIDLNSIYKPRLTFNGQAGSYGLGQFDYMYPLSRREETLFIIDGRFQSTTQNSLEGNLGLVYRQLVLDNNNIFGAYVWVDRSRTPEHKYFSQATIGGEFLGVTYDFRGNIYLPYGQSTQRLSPTFVGNVSGNTVS